MSAAIVQLRDDQLEALADLIAGRLAEKAPGELIDAAELARRIGRSREFVYDHADSFGAVRLGGGDRPRVWFRWPHAVDRLADLEQPLKRRRPRVAASNRPRRQRKATAVELLPIRDGGRDGQRRPTAAQVREHVEPRRTEA